MKTGKIYFLRRADGLVKVGFTANLKTRMASLSRAHGPLDVLRVINGDMSREHQIHFLLSRHHEFGEWFRYSDDVQSIIEGLPDGADAILSEDDARRRWKNGEAEFAAIAKQKVVRLVQVRRQRTGCTVEDCMVGITSDYGIGSSFMNHLINGRALTVGAFAMHTLTQALITELNVHRECLLADIKAVEAGEQLHRDGRVRYATASRIQAKKAARSAR